MRQGKEHPFSLLLGVALSAVTTDFSGNFCVFPATHARIKQLLLPGGGLQGVTGQGHFATAAAAADNPWGSGGGLPDFGHGARFGTEFCTEECH
jgi:hypothetical protein